MTNIDYQPLKITDWIPPEKVDYQEFADAMNANCSFVVEGHYASNRREMTPVEIAILKVFRLEKEVALLRAENEALKAGK